MNDPSQQVVDTLGLEGAERRGRRWWPVVAAIAIVGLAAGAYALRQHRTTAPQFVTDSVRQGVMALFSLPVNARLFTQLCWSSGIRARVGRCASPQNCLKISGGWCRS